jgi:chemotaxis protein MotB
MSRKKKHEHVNHERWLVSYADFITLLFAFFVVLFASGQNDKRKQIKLATSIQSAFNQMGIFDAHSKLPPISDSPGAGQSAAPAVITLPMPSPEQAMGVVKQHLNEVAGPEIRSGAIAVQQSGDGLVVSLQEAGFFDSGAADIRPSALPVLERIAASLPESPLRVEGHTDDVPIATEQFASNWELSSARASSIARLLLRHPNVHPRDLSVAGYAGYHPVASNATPEGRARNRRVDIVILTAPR